MDKETIRFLVIIVAFNKSFSDIYPLNSILNSNFFNGKIVLWDNSPQKQNIDRLDEINSNSIDIEYISDRANSGLSAVYNLLVKKEIINNKADYDYVVLFDQDTQIISDYFKKIQLIVYQYGKLPLILPILKSNNLIVSPADIKYFKGKYWKQKKVGLISAKDLCAINSGMVISSDIFISYGFSYDERLRFYGTDTQFMKFYSKSFTKVFVMDEIISHDLSILDKTESVNTKINKHKESMRALQVIYGTNILSLLAVEIYIFAFSLKMALKYKKIGFIL